MARTGRYTKEQLAEALARTGSLEEAGAELGLTPATISHHRDSLGMVRVHVHEEDVDEHARRVRDRQARKG